MNPVHIHLVLSHAPTVTIVIGCGLIVLGALWNSQDLKRAALGVFLLGTLLVVPLYLTGDPAQDAVKGLPGISDRILDQHQAIAAIALAGSVFLGILAAAGLFLFRRGKVISRWFAWMMLTVSLAIGGLLGWTAYLGGQIRHSEIREVNIPNN
jgi:hypothetical protein